jgi:transcriptional regulator with XRE-family HTH domain
MYNYSKLRGRIVEIVGSQTKFAQKLGISTGSLSMKLNNKVEFSLNDVNKAMKILSIPEEEMSKYFFDTSVQYY